MARYEFATHRLHVEAPLATGLSVPLLPEAFNYLAHVLRMPEGGRLLAFNGRDGEFRAVFRFTGRKSGEIVIEDQSLPQTLPGRIHLAFAPLKAARLDYMTQKAVEMGAASLTPVLTRRTQVRGLKPERLRANAIEAAEQCGVLALPEIAAETALEAWLDCLPGRDSLIFCDEDAPLSDPVGALRQASTAEAIHVLIGPEGGFDDSERKALISRPNAIRLALGPRILRADTAAVAALAIVQAALGDWRGSPR
ncbi:16S ribosomal RNA methyltransferase RsmE [Rhabdaerophilaceae bacterium]